MTLADSVLLYPHLDPHRSRQLFEQQQALTLTELREGASTHHPEAACSPTGGVPVREDKLAELQTTLRSLCDDFGFPEPIKTSKQGEFDRICGTLLRRDMGIVPADAAQEGVWSFLSIILVPELAPWRFQARHENRLLGKRRNALRRLWWRAHVLGPDLTSVPQGCSPLNEDEFVQIMERTTIAKNRRLAQQVMHSLWRVELEGFKGNRADLLREVIKLVRAERSHIAMDALSEEKLAAYLDTVVVEGMKRLALLGSASNSRL
jgi:Family of unknown function (DUF6339)